MGMGFGYGLGLGSRQQTTEPYIDLTLPQAANIIRAWSTRRNVAAYSNGIAALIDRDDDDPTGLPDADYETITFGNNGEITVPSGNDAYAFELYNHRLLTGESAGISKLTQDTYDLCPKIHDVSAGRYLTPVYTAGKFLQMPSADSVIETATAGIPTNGFSISLWVRCSSVAKASYFISRRSTGSGYLGVFRNYATILARIGSPLDTPLLTGMQANVWYHVVITAKGSTDEGNNGVNSYINASGKVTQDIKTVSAGATRFCIGYGLTNTDGTDNINDVILWDRELSGDEVLALFNAQCDYYGVSAK